MDVFTPLRIIKGQFLGLFNYLTFIEKKHDDSQNKLFIDITEVHIHDNGTGVPRVTNGIRQNIYKYDIPYKVVEVYAKAHNQGFFDAASNKPIKVSKGDFYFSLDFSKFKIPQNKRFIKKLLKNKIPCWFFLHDLIPINYPQYCKKVDIVTFKKWINIVKHFDGFIANSKSTENEMREWLNKQKDKSFNKNIKSGYIHIASTFLSNIENFCKDNHKLNLQFLAVSTVEPRKRYDLILDAFNLLWKENLTLSLTIVGKPGWNNEAICNKIRNHKEYGKNLLWFENFIPDEDLKKLYANSDALIFASDTEGFGSPLVEAATYRKPLIVRDIPIFREVTDNQAYFFKGNNPTELAEDIKKWISMYNEGRVTYPKIKLYSWEESTAETLKILFNNN